MKSAKKIAREESPKKKNRYAESPKTARKKSPEKVRSEKTSPRKRRRAGEDPRSSSSKRLAGMTIVFGPGGRDMTTGKVSMCTEKLQDQGAIVLTDWTDDSAVLVVSPFASEEKLEEFVEPKNPRDLRIVGFEWALETAVGKETDPVPDTANEKHCWFALRGNAKKIQEKEKESGSQASQETANSLDHRNQKETDDSRGWMNLIPPEHREQCEVFMNQGDQLGVVLSEKLKRVGKTPPKEPKDPRESYMAFRSGTSLAGENLNANITDQLQRLATVYESTNAAGGFKALSYKRAIDILKSLTFKVTHIEQVRHYRGIGQGILEKIEEILQSGNLKKADNVCQTEYSTTMNLLTKVHGIGPDVATSLFQKGFRTIESLRAPAGQATLSRVQKIGLKYFEDLQLRIPREEVAKIGDVVKQAVSELWPHRQVIGEVVGSYRRGQKDCGDVDMIFTTPNIGGCLPLKDLVDKLRISGFLVADLTEMKEEKQDTYGQVRGKQSYMGICKLVGPDQSYPARRIDIKIYPREMFAFALLYFTGNEHFNRSMRHYCKNKGLSMSDEGIFHAVRSSSGKDRFAKGKESIAKCFTELEVFEFLGFPFKLPSERNCDDQAIAKATAKKQWLGPQPPGLQE